MPGITVVAVQRLKVSFDVQCVCMRVVGLIMTVGGWWVVASAGGVGGTISNVGEAIETKNERRWL